MIDVLRILLTTKTKNLIMKKLLLVSLFFGLQFFTQEAKSSPNQSLFVVADT
jgi:hypothetical protein